MRGATVVASDLTPELFGPGRRRAQEHGVELEWVEADAEHLPFEDRSFDVAVSTFGIMFAPRQSAAAAELARVVRPGGRIALCSWRPTGFVAEVFAMIAASTSPPPPPEAPPVRWGTAEGAHELLDAEFEIRCEERTLVERYPAAIDEMTDHFLARFGPMVMTRRALEPEGRWEPFVAAYRELTYRYDQGDADEAALPAEYLLVTGVRNED
jgi:ubiquinone/menaquinone biosynthesis C-methylase UbiE